VSPAERPAVGIDVGGTKLLAVLLGTGGEVLAESHLPSPRTAPDLIAAVLDVAGSLAGGKPATVGIGAPGLVDAWGTLLFAPNLSGAAGAALGEALAAAGHRSWIGNDATAACWAEHQLGAGRGYTDLLMVTLGTGIGGGIVLGGRLIEGANRFAGEFGHMAIDPAGPPCGCGRRGCWERMASGFGLAALGQEAAAVGDAPGILAAAGGDPSSVKGEHVTQLALLGDPAAVAVMGRFAWWVAYGLANLINILDAQAIVIGGGLVDAGEVLLAPTRRAFVELVEAADVRPPVAIVAARLGPRAGAVGAGLLAKVSGDTANG
jgi:glucokinase